MEIDTSLPSEEGSDYSISDSDSEFEAFFNGYCCKMKRPKTDYISLPWLKTQYNEDMEIDKKVLLFFYAVDEEDISFLERLLGDEVPVDCVGKDGWTPLMKACLNGKVQSVEFLLNNGSNPNFQAALFTALMACCTYGGAEESKKLACTEYLLWRHADVNANDRHKITPLMHAASSGFESIVNRLLRVQGINAHARDFDGWTALFHAVSNNRSRTAMALIDWGLSYRDIDTFGRTPQILAEERGFYKLSELLKNIEDDGAENEEEIVEEDETSNCYSEYLRELPDSNGEGGFITDTKDVLFTYNCKMQQKIPFPDFLNMTDNDLLKAGVKINSQRRFLLRKVIHRFHLCPWRKSSMPPVTRDIGLEESICIVGSIVKHLALVKASLRYVKTRIDRRKKDGDLSIHKDSVKALVWCYDANEIIRQKLINMLKKEKTTTSHLPDDTIIKTKQPRWFERSACKYGLLILGATTAGYLISNFKTEIGDYIKDLTFITKIKL